MASRKGAVVVNPLRDLSDLHSKTTITSFLSLPNLSLGSYASKFHSAGIFTLGDLTRLKPEFFQREIGMNSGESSILTSAYLNWVNVYNYNKITKAGSSSEMKTPPGVIRVRKSTTIVQPNQKND